MQLNKEVLYDWGYQYFRLLNKIRNDVVKLYFTNEDMDNNDFAQYCKVISLQLIKKKERKKMILLKSFSQWMTESQVFWL